MACPELATVGIGPALEPLAGDEDAERNGSRDHQQGRPEGDLQVLPGLDAQVGRRGLVVTSMSANCHTVTSRTNSNPMAIGVMIRSKFHVRPEASRLDVVEAMTVPRPLLWPDRS